MSRYSRTHYAWLYTKWDGFIYWLTHTRAERRAARALHEVKE